MYVAAEAISSLCELLSQPKNLSLYHTDFVSVICAH